MIEYRVEVFDDKLVSDMKLLVATLNQLGKERWHLVAVKGNQYYFSRPVGGMIR